MESSVLLIHLRWPVADTSASVLTGEGLARLVSYLPRYAGTLGARCLAVGGVADHLHLLLVLPAAKSLQSVEDELRRASQRFLREVLGDTQFTWGTRENAFQSVSPSDRDSVVSYIESQRERHATGDLDDAFEAPSSASLPATDDGLPVQDEMPEWLRSAMNSPPERR